MVVSEDIARRYKLDKATVAPIGPGHFRGGPSTTNWTGKFHLTTLCSRNLSHTAIYYFETGSQPNIPRAVPVSANSSRKEDGESVEEEEKSSFILKIGQSPSLFDFQKDVLGDLSKGLTKEQAKDFVRAIQTYSHGYAVAACVYLRRVFQSILEQAKSEYLLKHELQTLENYEAEKTGQKIQLLKEHLPPFLVDRPHLYTLLSIGVHQLSEAECLKEFENLRGAIELIIKEKISMLEEGRRKKEISVLLSKSMSQHSNSD